MIIRCCKGLFLKKIKCAVRFSSWRNYVKMERNLLGWKIPFHQFIEMSFDGARLLCSCIALNNAVFFYLAPKRRQCDAEKLRRSALVPLDEREHLGYMLPFGIREGQSRGIIAGHGLRAGKQGFNFLHEYHFSSCAHHGGRDDVFKFSDIARPRVLHEPLYYPFLKPQYGSSQFSVGPVEKIVG